MANKKSDKKNQNDDDTMTSIGTPLGHVPLPKEAFNRPFVGWVKDMIDKDTLPDEEEDKE